MSTTITQLEWLEGYRLCVSFSDGSEGIHDFTALVNGTDPLLEALRNEAYFGQVSVESGALKWPNGFTVAPEPLRREMEARGEITVIETE